MLSERLRFREAPCLAVPCCRLTSGEVITDMKDTWSLWEGGLWSCLSHSRAPASCTRTLPGHQRLLSTAGMPPSKDNILLSTVLSYPGHGMLESLLCVPGTLDRLVLLTGGMASSLGSPLSPEEKMWDSL